MNNKENTHVCINGGKLIISPNLQPLFDFLIKIDNEILSVLDFNKKLNIIKNDTGDILKMTSHFAKIIQDNNLELDYKIDKNLLNIGDKFNFLIPTRVEFIMLFSYLEVLFSIYISFDREIDNKDDIRKLIMDSEETRKFISNFILNKKNNYFNKNSKKLGGISPSKLRDLRNSLTHFYSLGESGIILVDDNSKNENEKLKTEINKVGIKNINLLSSLDLYKLLSGVFGILISDFEKSYKNNKIDFKRKIQFTKNIIENHGAVKVEINK